jgi:hypothetical protein
MNKRRQTAGDDQVETRKSFLANRDVNATPVRYRMEQGYAARRIGPISRQKALRVIAGQERV